MFGAVCGDTVGSIYEFNETKDYGFVLFGKDSNFTDDSIMSVAVAAWLLKDESHSYESLEREMGGDSDTLACITGGIAEAYYMEIPEKIRSVVWSKLPEEFRETIRAVAERTPYGNVFKGYGL